MNKEKSLELINELEKLSRKGLGLLVRKKMRRLNFSKIPRAHRLKWANLARRNNLPFISIRILSPTVRSEQDLIQPTHEELAEYAASLLRIGATREAEQILAPLDKIELPKTLLFQSFIHISKWNYSAAIPLLQNYCSSNKIGEYQNIVGQVNLAAAYVFEHRIQEAQDLLNNITDLTKKKDYNVLLGNTLQLSAINNFNKKSYAEAKSCLQQASKLLRKSNNINDFLIRKWVAIIHLYEKPHSSNIQQIHKVKEEAINKKNWETLRDCDFHLSITTNDQKLFTHVYFGTPFPNYRYYLLRKKNDSWTLPHQYIFSNANLPQNVIDLSNGQLNQEKVLLKPGQLLHRTLNLLAQDLYHPPSLGTLFSILFPNEHFNVHSSPDRIYQLIRRLRLWIQKNKLPMSILEDHGTYRLKLGDDIGFKISLTESSESKESHNLILLKNSMGQKTFTAKEACNVLNVSRPTFSRWVSWGLQENVLEKKTAGPKTSYKIKSAA